MSSAASIPPQSAAPSRGPERSPLLTTIPSWLISLVLHAALFALFASGFWIDRSGDSAGEGEGEYREIGFYSPSPSQQDSPSEDASQSAETFSPEFAALSQAPPVTETAPVPLSVPASAAPPMIGFGGPPVTGTPSDVSELVRPSGIRGAGAPSGLGPGNTSFFGAKDRGKKFVYVVDCSGSMTGDPIMVAKAELKASLAALDENQQFQIIFYNQNPRVMTIRGDTQVQLYWATEINRTLAGQWISTIPADAGTNHVPALRRGLSMQPEVMFFLTDADQPELSAKELNELETLNGGRTRIHCIEFGKGPELNAENFLKKLARENGGTYRYRDVSKFRVR